MPMSMQDAVMGGVKATFWVGCGFAAAEVGTELLTASFDAIDDFYSSGQWQAAATRGGVGVAAAGLVGLAMWRSGNAEAAKVAVPLMVAGSVLSAGREYAQPYLQDAGDWVREMVGNPRGVSGAPSGGNQTSGAPQQGARVMQMSSRRAGADYGRSAGDLSMLRAGADLIGMTPSSPSRPVNSRMIGQTEILLARGY